MMSANHWWDKWWKTRKELQRQRKDDLVSAPPPTPQGGYRPKVGEWVMLNTPDNPTLHGANARVESLEGWGAHVISGAAASGKFRAAWHEMVKPIPLGDDRLSTSAHAKLARHGLSPSANHKANGLVVNHATREQGFTGDICSKCGGVRMIRSGSCATCMDCGETGGCG